MLVLISRCVNLLSDYATGHGLNYRFFDVEITSHNYSYPFEIRLKNQKYAKMWAVQPIGDVIYVRSHNDLARRMGNIRKYLYRQGSHIVTCHNVMHFCRIVMSDMKIFRIAIYDWKERESFTMKYTGIGICTLFS